MARERALIVVDLQNDFMPGGPLAVPEADGVAPLVNRLQPQFPLVVATQDWHPPDHVSFADNHPDKQPGDVIRVNDIEQTLWPVHCVQQTSGAELVDELEKGRIARVFQKGQDPEVDDYSGFYDNERKHSTGLAEYLRDQGVDEVFIAGVATDVCVKYTALDARRLGFRTYLVVDACRGVDLKPGDSDRAIDAMRDAGVALLTSDEVSAS